MADKEFSFTGEADYYYSDYVQALKDAGLVKKVRDGVKILGDGELTKKLTVKAHRFSTSAVSKIEASGGSVEVINA